MAEFERFRARYPKGKQAERLLVDLYFASRNEKSKFAERYLLLYPKGTYADTFFGIARQEKAVGQAFELVFNDAISGKSFDVSAMKGKVVLVDFWATWCGPCVAKMPELKELYREYHDQGLEIVGVSLDQSESEGGLKALKAFVAKNNVPWPMFYQGNGWESAFSKSWGIMSIPTVFIVDKKGILRSTQVSDPAQLIKTLLAEPGI